MNLKKIAISGAIMASVLLVPASSAFAADHAPAPSGMTIQQEYAKDGFPKKPSQAGWKNLMIAKGKNGAFTITGKAPKELKPGMSLKAYRYIPDGKFGDGSLDALNAKTKVRDDRTFTIVIKPGKPGTFGYAVGSTTEAEFEGFQFQLTR